MELQLKNIGMIKEANVKIDGLTVIAGENDTGKSTVGKALFIRLKLLHGHRTELGKVDFLISQLFKGSLRSSGEINLSLKNEKATIKIHPLKDMSGATMSDVSYINSTLLTPIFIETPLIWNLQDYFQTSVNIESQLKMIGESVDIPYPYLMKDTYFKLVTKRKLSENNLINIRESITSLMQGEFVKDDNRNIFYLQRDKELFDLINVATGIKTFGLFQVLLDNNRLDKNTVLILDEPEVHLHPKWQLEMAKLIVELVKNGVKILVNSHSPYMIEALQRYGELAKINSDFYLAEDGYIKKENDSNSETLAKIFEKLSEPFDVFEEMDSKSLGKLING